MTNGTVYTRSEDDVRNQESVAALRSIASRMGAWLKFLGVASIFLGAFIAVITYGIGLLFAWMPIWLGVLLFQAGERAGRAGQDSDPHPLIELLEKLRSYFVVYSVAAIVVITMMIILTIFIANQFGSIDSTAIREFIYY